MMMGKICACIIKLRNGWIIIVGRVFYALHILVLKMRVLVNVSVNCALNWVIGIISGLYYVHMIWCMILYCLA